MSALQSSARELLRTSSTGAGERRFCCAGDVAVGQRNVARLRVYRAPCIGDASEQEMTGNKSSGARYIGNEGVWVWQR